MPSDSPPRSRSTNRGLWLGLAAVAVVLVCGGCGLGGAGFVALVYLAEPQDPAVVAVEPVLGEHTPAPGSPLHADGIFLRAAAETGTAPAPARFDAPLPAMNTDDWDRFEAGDEAFPPYSHVSALACSGDPGMGARLVDSVRRSDAGGVSADDLRYGYGAFYARCYEDDARACTFLLSVVNGGDPATVKGPFWSALGDRCDGPAVRTALEQAAAPGDAYLAWAKGQSDRGRAVGWSKKLEGAVAAEIKNGDVCATYETAMLLGATDDPRSARSLMAIHSAERDPEKRSNVASAMALQSDPAARAIYRASCGRNCDAVRSWSLASGDVEQLVSDFAIDLRELVAESKGARRDEVLAELVTCVGDADALRVAECLDVLASEDWAGAKSAAASRSGVEGGLMAADREALATLRGAAGTGGRLGEDGLLLRGDVDRRGASTRMALEANGRAISFDRSRSGEHDLLLQRLASLVRPELDGVVFLSDGTLDENGPGRVRLQAWLGGKHWTVHARDFTDVYDVRACVGLVNTMLADRGSTLRLVELESDDEVISAIAAGPKDALTRAVEQGRLLVAAERE